MSPIVQASALALGYLHRPPHTLIAQAPHYLGGGYAPLDAGTFAAALASANTALEGAQTLLDGQRCAYALCRPPGHHAYAAMAGGFCYLNNIAIAAQHLLERFGRVSILDIDVHHGNGTQALFYERDDVMTVSVHVDPTHIYPFCCGFADEIGAGRGRGWNLNLPLPAGSSDGPYLEAIERGIARIRTTGSSALLVALGFDAYAGDPTAAMAVSTAGFRVAGALIGALELPTLLVQEGGYAVDALGVNVKAFLRGLMEPASR
jgi:acetoin utilization deacetylase AcuC-like enzyme